MALNGDCTVTPKVCLCHYEFGHVPTYQEHNSGRIFLLHLHSGKEAQHSSGSLRNHSYITLAKGLNEWVQKTAVLAVVQYCIHDDIKSVKLEYNMLVRWFGGLGQMTC